MRGEANFYDSPRAFSFSFEEFALVGCFFLFFFSKVNLIPGLPYPEFLKFHSHLETESICRIARQAENDGIIRAFEIAAGSRGIRTFEGMKYCAIDLRR